MADNETNIGNPSVDVDIIPKVVSLEQLMAQLVRSFAELKPVIYARVAIDRAVTGGVGEQVQRAVDEVANKLRLSFQAIGRADELQTGFRAIESHLQQITADAEKAGQALTMSLKGPSGEGTYTLKGRQGVSEFINRMPQYSAALGPSGSPITAGIGANINPSDANLESVKAIRESTGAITARTKAEQEAANTAKRQQEAGDKLAKWMDLWASGGRPQRALGSFLQGPLTAALGPEMGAMGAGLGAMLGGGALFHIGWAITNELSKLPEHIMEQIDIAREFNRMRAAATTGPPVLDNMPAASPEAMARLQTDQTLQPRVQAAHDFWTRMRGDPKRYDSIMASLLMNVPAGDMKDAKKRDHWIETIDQLANQSLLAETMFPGETGKAENVAYTRFRMLVEHGGKGREALLGQTAFMDMAIQRLQDEYPHLQTKNGKGPPRETLERVVRARVSGPSGNVAGGRFPGQWTAEDIDQLISSGMGATPQMESVIQQMMGETNWKAWRQENHILWTDYSQHSTKEREFLSTAQQLLSPTERLQEPYQTQYFVTPSDIAERENAYRRLGAYDKSHRDAAGKLRIAPADVEGVGNDIQTYMGVGGPSMVGDYAKRFTPEQMRKLMPAGQAGAGDIGAMFGTDVKPPHLPAWGPGTYSFSSMSGFANKMQAEAGIHLDWNEKNHDELIQIHAVLAARLNPPDPGGHKPIETPAAN